MAINSMATQGEDWIVAEIRAIEVASQAVFETNEVRPWGGSQQKLQSASDVAEELFSGAGSRAVRVLEVRDATKPLEAGGQVELVTTYSILFGVRNFANPGEARRGSASFLGINDIRSLIAKALHNKRPYLNDGVWCTTKTQWLGSSITHLSATVCIAEAQLAIPEIPKGTS